jgi:hypothetical protein
VSDNAQKIKVIPKSHSKFVNISEHLLVSWYEYWIMTSQSCWIRRQFDSLVGLMIIDAEFNRNDYGSIFCNCDWEKTETTWCQN